MPKVAIIGANGQLGTDCMRAFAEAGYATVPLNHEELDVVDADGVRAAFSEVRPEVVVNTAAMHNVEDCESDPARAFEVNALGARNVAVAAADVGARLLHISTDYVFDGGKRAPYQEDDLPRPLNTYGVTKLAGEHYVVAEAADASVVRTSGLYGSSPCRAKGGLNFVRLMLKLARERGEVKVVTDEVVTPTCTRDLARQLVALAASDCSGVVHATAGDECSWYEFADAIFELTGTDVRLGTATSADFPSKVPRPGYSVLANGRLEREGIDRMPHWRDSLTAYLTEIGEVATPVPRAATG